MRVNWERATVEGPDEVTGNVSVVLELIGSQLSEDEVADAIEAAMENLDQPASPDLMTVAVEDNNTVRIGLHRQGVHGVQPRRMIRYVDALVAAAADRGFQAALDPSGGAATSDQLEAELRSAG